MSKQEKLRTVEDFFEHAERLPINEVWELAVIAVSVAGYRASKLHNIEVNKLCALFVEKMHEYVDTPMPAGPVAGPGLQ